MSVLFPCFGGPPRTTISSDHLDALNIQTRFVVVPELLENPFNIEVDCGPTASSPGRRFIHDSHNRMSQERAATLPVFQLYS